MSGEVTTRKKKKKTTARLEEDEKLRERKVESNRVIVAATAAAELPAKKGARSGVCYRLLLLALVAIFLGGLFTVVAYPSLSVDKLQQLTSLDLQAWGSEALLPNFQGLSQADLQQGLDAGLSRSTHLFKDIQLSVEHSLSVLVENANAILATSTSCSFQLYNDILGSSGAETIDLSGEAPEAKTAPADPKDSAMPPEAPEVLPPPENVGIAEGVPVLLPDPEEVTGQEAAPMARDVKKQVDAAAVRLEVALTAKQIQEKLIQVEAENRKLAMEFPAQTAELAMNEIPQPVTEDTGPLGPASESPLSENAAKAVEDVQAKTTESDTTENINNAQ